MSIHINQMLREEILSTVESLASSRFSKRAEDYDEHKSFPKEDFSDLHDAGLLGSLIGKEFGGLGLGHTKGDILTHWLITKILAKADMSLARCWEGHSNAMLLIDNLGSESQKKNWFKGVIDQGDIWSAWSGEPLVPKPNQKNKIGTDVLELPDGYIVNGTKVFCTAAPEANYAILFVNTAGAGGARHGNSDETLLMLACDMNDESITYDDSWWDPIGMRGSVSYLVKFENTFIAKDNLIGTPGQYLREDWQTYFTPQYAATFLGGAEAAYDYTKEYISHQNRAQDPYVQQRIAKMWLNIESGQQWLHETANLWENGHEKAAKLKGNGARYFIEHLCTDVLNHAIHICGARSMIKPSALERIYRDLSFYVRHDNDDHLLAMIGRSILGEDHDISFFRPNTADNKSKMGDLTSKPHSSI